jgi:GntR family transcriptional regulator
MGVAEVARPLRGRGASRGVGTGRRRLGAVGRTVTPLYHQMYLVLAGQIRAGDFDPAQPMPGEHQLAARFGVSRVTVRRTLAQLELEGLVVRRHGVGTFPAARPSRMQDRYSIGGLKDPAEAGGRAAIVTLDVAAVPAPAHVAAAFGSADPVLRILRQRAVGRGEPFTLLTTWLPADRAAVLSRRQLQSAQTLDALEAAGVVVVRAEQSVSAQAADDRVAGLLRVPVGTPLLAMSTLFGDGGGVPVALFEALYRPDRYEYRLAMVRRGSRWQLVE